MMHTSPVVDSVRPPLAICAPRSRSAAEQSETIAVQCRVMTVFPVPVVARTTKSGSCVERVPCQKFS
jgi:hypothetical protein